MTCNNVTLFLSLSIYLSFFLSLPIYLSLYLTLSHYTIPISLYNLYLTIQSLSHYTAISLSLCISNSIHSVFFSHSFNITLTKAQPCFLTTYPSILCLQSLSLSLSLSLSPYLDSHNKHFILQFFLYLLLSYFLSIYLIFVRQ